MNKQKTWLDIISEKIDEDIKAMNKAMEENNKTSEREYSFLEAVDYLVKNKNSKLKVKNKNNYICIEDDKILLLDDLGNVLPMTVSNCCYSYIVQDKMHTIKNEDIIKELKNEKTLYFSVQCAENIKGKIKVNKGIPFISIKNKNIKESDYFPIFIQALMYGKWEIKEK